MNIIEKEDEEEETDTHIIITSKEINEHGIVTYEHFLNNELIDGFAQLKGRVVFTELGSVQRLFYSEIEKGSVYNLKVQTSKGSIVAFAVRV